jgi:hypothetical protein
LLPVVAVLLLLRNLALSCLRHRLAVAEVTSLLHSHLNLVVVARLRQHRR